MSGKKNPPDVSGYSPLEIRFIHAFVNNGGNATEAAKEAGCNCNTEESFQVRGSQLKAKLDGPIGDLMKYAGLTSLDILRTLANGLNATRETVGFTKFGDTVVHESPDWPARLKATDIAIKLQGGYPKAQLELPFSVDENGHLVITAEFDNAGAGMGASF